MKILFVACYSPLINNSAAIETLWYLNKLVELGSDEIHLLTLDFPKDCIYYDEEILKLLDPRIKVHSVTGGFIFNLVVPKKTEHNKSKVSTNLNRRNNLIKRVKSIIAIPDAYRTWSKNAYSYWRKNLSKENFDIMISMHEPPSSHLAAYKIKKIDDKIKWVTYWSDPWTKDSSRLEDMSIKKSIEKTLEKKIVEYSDNFIFVTDANRRDFIKEYNLDEDKTSLINRGYDRKHYEDLKLKPMPKLINDKKINIVYAGEIFSRLRDIKPFAAALSTLKDKHREIYDRLNILFFGNIDDGVAINQLSEHEIVSLNSRIPYEEALGYMLNANILLVLGNKNSNQIPAKIYDYFGTEGYIFAILGDREDPLLKVVENKEKCFISLNNEEDIYKNLLCAFSQAEGCRKSSPLDEYEWSNIALRLREAIIK